MIEGNMVSGGEIPIRHLAGRGDGSEDQRRSEEVSMAGRGGFQGGNLGKAFREEGSQGGSNGGGAQRWGRV